MKITFNICLSDIPKERIYTSQASGKKYIDIDIIQLREPDMYGNEYSALVRQTREEREANAPAVWIGKGKEFNPAPKAEPEPAPIGGEEGHETPLW